MSIKVIVDLRSQFGPIRDQGPRPTCMAFAASDAHSFARQNPDPLSAEYAYFHAVQRRTYTDRTTGVSFPAMAEAISLDGQPVDAGWPYNPGLGPTDDWVPPHDPGQLFYRGASQLIGELGAIYDRLDGGHTIIVAMQISQSFFQLGLGEVLNAPMTEPTLGTHALVAVGYGQINKHRCLMVRNSWGVGWADHGYGWIHEDYMKPRLLLVGEMNL
jgi:hypothetical protein